MESRCVRRLPARDSGEQPPLPRTLLLAALVVLLALIWFPSVALLVDRLGRWLRRPRTARAIEGGSGAALTALGLVLVTGPLMHCSTW